MYSNMANIDEVWSKDPIKDITNKINQGLFTSRIKYEDINGKNDTSTIKHDPQSELDLSLIKSTSTYTRNNRDRKKYSRDRMMLSSEKESCAFSIRHLEQCESCYIKLKKLVTNRINHKIDDAILDLKMEQIKKLNGNTTIGHNLDNWKEIIIIIFGLMFLFMIMVMIGKVCMN